MSFLIKSTKLSQIAKAKVPAPLFTAVRHNWHKDWKAAKEPPKTPEEIEKAARKYNLHPSEYKTYEADGLGWGDYPKLPDVPVESKNIYEPWDMPEHRRNFGEPIHIDYPLWSEDRYGTAAPLRYTGPQMAAMFFGGMAFWFLAYWWANDKKMFRPVMEKQYPKKAHYSFEPAN